jgi:thiamine biosynthesis protein ThiS
MGMIITINGKKEEIESEMTISKLLEAKKIRPEVVTIELNDNIIERSRYPELTLKAGDRLEFVYYMGGGR